MMKKVISYIALIVLGFCFLLPFLIMILGSFKDVQYAQLDPLFWIPDDPTMKNYIYIMRDGIFIRWIFNSVIITVIPVASQMIFCCGFRLYFCEETIPRARNRILGFHGSYHDSTAIINYS